MSYGDDGLRAFIPSPFTCHLSRPFSLARRRARPRTRAHQRLQLLHELGHVLELQVDRSEADVGDLFEFLQAAHDHLADLRRRALPLRRLLHVLLDGVDDAVELRGRDGPFLAGAQQPGHHLVAVERLAPPVLLDDHVGDFVNALVGREPPLALQALAAAANRVALARLARVNDLVFKVTAEGASHKFSLADLSRAERAFDSSSARRTSKLTAQQPAGLDCRTRPSGFKSDTLRPPSPAVVFSASRARRPRRPARLFPPRLRRRGLRLRLFRRDQLAQAREAEAASEEVVEAEEEGRAEDDEVEDNRRGL